MKIWNTKGNELVTTRIGTLCMIVSGRRPFEDPVWSHYISICRELGDEGPVTAAFNYSPIVGPTAAQRKEFTSRLSDVLPTFKRTALLSDSALVRGALTATTWLQRAGSMQLRAFSPLQSNAAFEWLSVVAEFKLEEAQTAFVELLRLQGDDPMGLLKASS